MAHLTVRPATDADLPHLARLLCERHTRDAPRLAGDTGLFTREEPCTVVTRRLFDNPRADGAVALRGGRIVGYLFGERMMFAPDHDAARFFDPHSIAMPVLGHACAGDEDATAVYCALYGHLAARWVAGGFFSHVTHIPAGDAALERAWVALGFGGQITAAVRPTTPVEAPVTRSVEVHCAGVEDLEVVLALSDTLRRHHAGAPMFWPLVHDADAAARDAHARALADPANAHFIAYEGGRPLGMQTFLKPGYTPAIVSSDQTIYLYEGVVEPDVRSGGVGTALLAASMAWCRDEGYDHCCLHFAAGNPSGAPFWLRHGFVPVEYTMHRLVDERIAWANH